jgi:hypothetical protein
MVTLLWNRLLQSESLRSDENTCYCDITSFGWVRINTPSEI